MAGILATIAGAVETMSSFADDFKSTMGTGAERFSDAVSDALPGPVGDAIDFLGEDRGSVNVGAGYGGTEIANASAPDATKQIQNIGAQAGIANPSLGQLKSGPGLNDVGIPDLPTFKPPAQNPDPYGYDKALEDAQAIEDAAGIPENISIEKGMLEDTTLTDPAPAPGMLED